MEITDISAYDSYTAWHSDANSLIQKPQADENKGDSGSSLPADGRGQVVDTTA